MHTTHVDHRLRPLLMLLPLLVLAAVVATFVALAGVADEAAHMAPATCIAHGCYCEAVATHGVRQMIDAWSSLSPALGGTLILWFALGRRPRDRIRLAQSRLPSVLLALAACSIAIFSFHYHATLTWLGEWLDGVSLFLLAGFGLAWAVGRRFALGPAAFALCYAAIAALPALVSWFAPDTRKLTFVAMALAAIAIEWHWRRRKLTRARSGFLWLAVGSFSLAGIAWLLDWNRVICDPQSPLQLHALWHILSAPTVVALDRYFASEAPATQ